MADSAHTYPTISSGQASKEVTANQLILAGSPNLLFGVDPRTTPGLNFRYLGGKYPKADGTILTIDDATLPLTASATNYVKETDGVVSVTTTAPTGWPGPLASSAKALYEVTCNSATATSYIDYRTPTRGTVGQGVPVGGTTGQVLSKINSTDYNTQWVTPATGSGTVTSVAASVPAFLSISGSPVTTSGTLAITYSGTALPVANGGTGDTSLTAYAPVFGGTTSTGALQSGTVGTSGQVLTSNGAGALPTFQAAASSSPLTTKGDLYTYGTGNARLGVGTDGQVLTADSAQTLGVKWAAASGGGGTSITGTTGATGGNATATGGTSTTSANAGGKFIATGGTPGATGIGGAVEITGGPGGSTSGGGGAVTITGGTPINGEGGAVTITSGAGVVSAGAGNVTIQGGTAATTTGWGVTKIAGGLASGLTARSAVTLTDSIAIVASTSGYTGGLPSVTITGGSGGVSASDGGAVTITGGRAGSGYSGNVGGNATLKGGPGAALADSIPGSANVQGGDGATTGTGSRGGDTNINGGIAGGSGNNRGGNVNLKPGTATGTGAVGHVVLNGSGAALATTATGGFTCLPTCAGTPTGVPANIPTGTVPMVVDTTGSKFWLYIGGTWKGVVVA